MSVGYAGVDLGGTRIKAALADSQGQLIAESVCETEASLGPDHVIDRMASLVSQLTESSQVTLAAVGVGVPGLVDLGTGTTKFLPNLPTQWRDVPVAKGLGSSLKCQVRLLNDARMATLGELSFGHGANRAGLTMAYLGLGTGVGGGVVVEGKLRLGELGAAGELGHMTVRPGGKRCGCGGRGCLETLVSGPAIAAEGHRLIHSGQAPHLAKLVRQSGRAVDTQLMAQAAEAGESSVAEILDQVAEDLGIGIANIVTMLDPELVVVGGGVALIGSRLFDQVRAVVVDRVNMFPADRVAIELSRLDDKAGMMGGVALAMNPVA